MAEPVPPGLIAPLLALTKWLEAAAIPAAIVGGVAVSLLGRPRFTRDIDALAILAEQDWESAVATAARFGILPRIDNALEFARRTRVLLLRHVESAIDLDVILGGLSFEEQAVARAVTYDIGGVNIRLPRVEDLLIMKAVAHRPQDLQDIQALLAAHPEADVESARRWVREFAAATSMSELLEDFERAVERRNPPE